LLLLLLLLLLLRPRSTYCSCGSRLLLLLLLLPRRRAAPAGLVNACTQLPRCLVFACMLRPAATDEHPRSMLCQDVRADEQHCRP
jgi:hypothetical protein